MELDDDALRVLADEARAAAIAAGTGDHSGVEAYLDALVERTLAHATQEAAVRAMEPHALHVVMEARRERVDVGFFP